MLHEAELLHDAQLGGQAVLVDIHNQLNRENTMQEKRKTEAHNEMRTIKKTAAISTSIINILKHCPSADNVLLESLQLVQLEVNQQPSGTGSVEAGPAPQLTTRGSHAVTKKHKTRLIVHRRSEMSTMPETTTTIKMKLHTSTNAICFIFQIVRIRSWNTHAFGTFGWSAGDTFTTIGTFTNACYIEFRRKMKWHRNQNHIRKNAESCH